MSTARARIALLPWGDVIEDYLDSAGISFEAFCSEMSGGWLFGYVSALREVGVETEVICVSARARDITCHRHVATGARIWLLPASPLYRRLSRRSRAAAAPATAAPARLSARLSARLERRALDALLPYLATPLRALRRVLRQSGCRALLCQEYEYARFDVCTVLACALGLPRFASFQGGQDRGGSLARLVRPLTLRLASGLIVGSAAEERRLIARHPSLAARIARIPNPVDTAEWRCGDGVAARESLDLPASATVIAWHGRVDIHRKGLDLLLEAWETMRRSPAADRLWLLLIGDGVDAGALRARLDARRGSNVRFVERFVLDRPTLRDYLHAADLYVLPSRHEGFAVAPLEAMACGLALVVTDVPGAIEAIGTGEQCCGIVVPAGDARALADALGTLAADTARREALRARARRRAERFSFVHVGERLAQLML